MNVCTQHHMVQLAHFDRAPIHEHDPISHTAFSVYVCLRCPASDVFPTSNYLLTTPPFQDLLARLLLMSGHFITITIDPTRE